MRVAISVKGAPTPVGPYSPGIRAGDMIFLSGQLGIDPESGALVDGEVRSQAERALRNISILCEASGFSLANVVKTTVFMTDLADFEVINELYADAFDHPRPARSAIEVSALPLGALVEIEAVLHCGATD